tara:strand:- start:74 stop:397 length:324 start_codon:yes stop_codon:yes gene_type:complete
MINTNDDNIQCIDSFIKRFPDYAERFSETIDFIENFVTNNTHEINSYKGVYSILNIGMGCCVYIRYDISEKSFLGYFLHSDCYGQYGESTNNFKKAKDFVNEYILVN